MPELGVDFGTSNTAAVVRWPDGRARPLLFDGSPLLPSAVYAENDMLVVGRDAISSSRLDPARFEPNPKRCIDDGALLLGDREVPVVDAIAAVLARVADEFRRTAGTDDASVTLTCPATWGATRRSVLTDAAARVGFGSVRLVAEPVAAATYFAQVLGHEVPVGSVVVVHDLGAGTFDASVVARTSAGFDVLAVDGRDDIGGLDVDAAVIDYLGRSQDPVSWARLAAPSTVEDRRAKLLLWDDVRAAKERLSRHPSADLVIPLADLTVHLTRDELEELAEPLLEQTVRVTQGVIRWANLAPGRLAGVFLVGGSSRIPLLATLLHRALGEAPVVLEQPELVVAEGSVLAGALALGSTGDAPGPATGLLPRIPAEEWGVAGAPAAPLPTSTLGGGGERAMDAAEGVASPDEPVPSPGAAPAAAPAARTVGRVIVPEAQPPGRTRATAEPVAPTRVLPRAELPGQVPPAAKAVPPAVQASPPPAATRSASGQVPPEAGRSAAGQAASPPGRTRSATGQPGAMRSGSARPYAPQVYPPQARKQGSSGRTRRLGIRLLTALVVIAVPVLAALIAYQITVRGR